MNDQQITKEMLKALNAAQAKLDAVKQAKEEPIAIIGMGCRFPGAQDLNAFWELLLNGVDAISEVPANRWDINSYYDSDPEAAGKMYSRYGGFLKNVDLFDAQFFDISPKEAKTLDPQQRLLLEVAMEALEHANQPLEKLFQSATGVFIAISSSDYALRMQSSNTAIDANLGTGTLLSPAAGRISYFLGVQGPSMVVDTACSSSLVAVHQAINSLRNRESNLVLVGGVSVIAAPNLTVAFSRAKMLSPDSRCKTFDASANGYVRSEGCGVIVLKRLSDAIKEGDNILAILKGSAVNQDGASGGLTIPNGPSQEAVIRQALLNANMKAQDINYVEAHGTGTSLGDPIEVNALGNVFLERENPLIIGSVKTNIGHAEAAAGMAALIKVVLALHNEKIPKNLHFKQANPHIPWHTLPVTVATTQTAWQRTNKQRAAGISAFGFSGTNAHVIVAEAPAIPMSVINEKNHHVYLLTLSAKTAAALEAQVEQYLTYLTTHTDVAIADICFTSNLRRTHFKERLALVVSSVFAAKEKLLAYQAKQNNKGIYHNQYDEPQSQNTAAYTENSNWEKQIETIADLYIRGERISWEHYFHDQAYNNIALPTYPWQKARYWIDTMHQNTLSSLSSSVLHPFLHRRLHSSVMQTGQIIFESTIIIDDFTYLSEHRLYDKAVFLGAGYIEMALAAAVEIFHAGNYSYDSALAIQELLIKQPLILSELHASSLVQVILLPNDKGYDFKIMSLNSAQDETWIEHIQGQIKPIASQSTPAPFDLNVLKQKINQEIDTAGYYKQFSSIGVDYGPAFHVINQLWWDGVSGDVLGLIDLPEVVSGTDKYYLHPLLLDGCFQLLAAALQIKSHDEKIYYLLRLENLTILQRPSSKLWCYIRPVTHKNTGALSSFDAYLLNERGEVVAELLNLQTHRADRNALLSHATRQWYYETLWQVRPLTLKDNALLNALQDKKNQQGAWLVLADRSGFGDKIAVFLRAQGQHCMMAFSVEDLDQLFKESMNYQHIIHLWSIDKNFNTALTELTDTLELSVGLLSCIQAVVKATGTKKQLPRLCVVTHHAQAVGVVAQEVEQAALWGLGRVLALEYLEFKSLFIDIDSASEQEVENVLEEILFSEREQQIVLRRHERYVARLRHAQVVEQKNALSINPEASYLITGGLGGLGLLVADHLVELGARRLVLVSRQGAATSEAQAAVQRLESKGVNVKVIKCDISQVKALSELRNEVDDSLRGIIHTAGVLDDGMLLDQSPQRFAKVLAPKVQGTWNLHQLSQQYTVDFFVCFSSMTSVMGAMGQANYAVANAFMDAFCQYRHALNLPGLSISWGPWDSAGMASNQDLKNHWQKIGMGVIAPAQGMEVLTRLLNSQEYHMGVIAMEWEKYPDESILFEYLKSTLQKKVEEKASNIVTEIAATQGEQRKNLLIQYIESQICHILEYENGQSFSITQGFFELGINSLTSVEFRNNLQRDLGCRLPSTLVFDYPTIKKLVEYLVNDVFANKNKMQEIEEPVILVEKQNIANMYQPASSDDAAEALAKELGIVWE